MDDKFINPFLHGTAEVLSKVAFIQPTAGKPFVKTDDTARGDISGIIGITGDAIGSLAIIFQEECIIYIVNKMLRATHTGMNKEVLDAVGELTAMISGAAIKLMEKDNLTVFAAIPTVVSGKAHTIHHVIKGPGIVIPFQTEKGKFVIDVCLQSPIQQQAKNLPPQEQKPLDMKVVDPIENKDMGERLNRLKQILSETLATRDALIKQLKEQPFMEWAQKQRYKKTLPTYDAKIKRLNLDITAAETIAKMSKDDLENPKIKPHFQHYPTKQTAPKPEDKK